MLKICRIAIAVSLSLSSISLLAVETTDKVDELPILAPESQHATSSKRVTAQFTRAHYTKIKMDDVLSEKVFDRYIKQLDYARNVFIATDIADFHKYRYEFDRIIARGKLDIPYEIFNLNLQRRLERYEFALSLLDKPFDFTKDEVYNFDREDAAWPKDIAELNELWRLKVKYDALNLTLADKKWPKIK